MHTCGIDRQGRSWSNGHMETTITIEDEARTEQAADERVCPHCGACTETLFCRTDDGLAGVCEVCGRSIR